MNENDEQRRKQRRRMIILIIILLLLLFATGLCIYKLLNTKTAVIVRTDEQLHDITDGQMRIRICSDIRVVDGSMQNLNFENINEARLMRCFIRLEGSDKYCYKSQYIEPGEIIVADLIDSSELKRGSNYGIAELYTYDMETKEQIGHVNVKVILER